MMMILWSQGHYEKTVERTGGINMYKFTNIYLLQPLFVEEVFAERNICGTLFESPAFFSGQVAFFIICSDSDTTPLSFNKVNVIAMLYTC